MSMSKGAFAEKSSGRLYAAWIVKKVKVAEFKKTVYQSRYQLFAEHLQSQLKNAMIPAF